jgi:hypothetical protein
LSSCSSPDIRQQNHGNNEEAICTTARQPHIPLDAGLIMPPQLDLGAVRQPGSDRLQLGGQAF